MWPHCVIIESSLQWEDFNVFHPSRSSPKLTKALFCFIPPGDSSPVQTSKSQTGSLPYMKGKYWNTLLYLYEYVWMYIYTYVYIYTYLFHHLGGYQHSMSKPHCWWRRLSQTNPAYRWSPPAFYENATSTHLHLLESRGCTDQAKIWIWKPTLSNIILSRQPHVTTKQVDFSILSHAFLCC